MKKTMVRKTSPEKRAQFLNSALKLFVKNGVQQTSTAEITQDAGTAAGTLFLYFPTKQDLVNELILKVGREQSEYITSLLQPSMPARETFLTIWNGSIRWFLENLGAYKYYRQVKDSRLISEEVIQESAKYLGYYFAAIQKGLAEGCIKTYPFELIGEMLSQDLSGIMDLIERQPDPSKQEEYIRLGFDLFWDGIKTARD
jgi:AcrR family transcriptional regulator